MGYLLLALVTLFFGIQSELCVSGDIFVRKSLLLWGALFYTVAGLLCILYKRNELVLKLLVSYIFIHGWLVAEFSKPQNPCYICISLLFISVILAVLYWQPFPNISNNIKNILFAVSPIRVLILTIVVTLIASPILPKKLSSALPSGMPLSESTVVKPLPPTLR